MPIDEFNSILKKERVAELIPFLKTLTKEGKKEIASSLKSLAKEYLEFRQDSSLLGQGAFKQKATKTQADILYATAFFCLNRKEFQKFDSFGQFLANSIIDNILPHYCPEWYSDVVNDLTKREWLPWHFDYRHAMNLMEKGFLIPSDELISRLIPQMIFERDQNHKYSYVPSNLEKWPITLEKHIWLIFQFETTIHFSDRYHQFQNSKKDFRHWIEALRDCARKGLIDRERLLRESILATGRNFNKSLSGWFVELFEALEPTRTELLILQSELINTLSSKHSKAINAALSSIKEIIDDREFNASVFLDNVPILLASETKSAVSKSISLLEKIIRNNPNFQEQACIQLTQAFIHNDEEIQNKAAKLLVKYNDETKQSVNKEIAQYADSILMSAKTILADLISNTNDNNSEQIAAEPFPSSSPIAVEKLNSIDELIFLASQAFDNNDPLHIDLLPAALVELQNKIDGSVLQKLEPALQRAYGLVMNDWPSTMGYLDHLLATFFIDTTKLFISKYPNEGLSLQNIHDSFKKKDSENKTKWSWYSSRILELATWSVHTRDTTYIIHKAILINAYEKIRANLRLPLLSTPTHLYGFVDPLILVNRLAVYQQTSQVPDNYDFQLALSRIAPFNHTEAIQETANTLKGEISRILQFVLDPNLRPSPPFETPSLWFMAGITKSPLATFPEFRHLFYSTLPISTFTGNIPWRSFIEHYKTTRYNYEKKSAEEVPAERNVLRLTLNPSLSIWKETEKKKENIISKLAKLITPSKKADREDVYILYEFLSLKAQFLSVEHNDVQRFIYLFPSNPNPLIALITAKALEHSTFASETDKRIITKTLEALTNLRFEYTQITYLFIATCMLTSDKTIRSFAAELWINGVNSFEIDSSEIGRIIGIHISGQYAPVKRLTDLISANLLKISPKHNKGLQSMITSIIENIHIDPPIGTKRLLEIYCETLSLNRSSLQSEKVQHKLTMWTTSASLKKIVNTLINTTGGQLIVGSTPTPSAD